MAQFQIFTYQFREVRDNQMELFGHEVDSTESMERKQELFEQEWATENNWVFKAKDVEYKHKLLEHKDHIIVFRIANNKKVRRENNFQYEMLDDRPSCVAIIDNRHNRQQIAIQKNQAFAKQTRVAEILQWVFCERMKRHKLAIDIRPRYEIGEFWDIVDKSPLGVSYLKFSFSPRNLPWLSGNVKRFFNELNDNFQGESTLEMKSLDNVPLKIDKADDILADMLEVSATAGVPVSIKLVDFKTTFTTGTETKIMLPLEDSTIRSLDNPDRKFQTSIDDPAWEHIVEFVNEIKLLHNNSD